MVYQLFCKRCGQAASTIELVCHTGCGRTNTWVMRPPRLPSSPPEDFDHLSDGDRRLLRSFRIAADDTPVVNGEG